jgi:LmbE family N-acetylglucosaminyl deacetylase
LNYSFRKDLFIVCFVIFSLYFTCSFAEEVFSIQKLEPFKRDERVLILAPHPDDEAIACAGVIQEALSKGAKVKVAFLTNGEHNEFAFIVYEKRITLKKNEFILLGEVRRQESIKAMELLGLKAEDLVFLGYPDFGTFNIFIKHWETDKPFRSLLTRISEVPYKDGLSYQASYVGENVIKDLTAVILDYRPDKIFVSHPADVNVDHKTYYLFLQVVLADLKDKISPPKVYPYLVHRVGWPLPRHYHPKLALIPPGDLQDSQIRWLKFDLSQEQLDKKHEAILCYKSQTESSAFYLLSFGRTNELFGDYSVVNLKNQPSLKAKPTAFFGFSKLFLDTDPENGIDTDNLMGDGGQVSYAVEDNSLVIRVEKSKNIIYRFSSMIYLFGYSYDKPFAEMPKLRIITKHDNFKVLDGSKIINPEGVSLKLKPDVFILKIPLNILGNPSFVLASVKSYTGKTQENKTSFYSTGFRKINLD